MFDGKAIELTSESMSDIYLLGRISARLPPRDTTAQDKDGGQRCLWLKLDDLIRLAAG